MSGPKLVALSATLTTLFFYFLIGYKRRHEIRTIDDFFLYNRKLDAAGYESTFVATAISLATVLFFFLDFTGQLGLSLLLSPLMYGLGCYVFLCVLPVLDRTEYLSRGTTLHNYIGVAFSSPSLRVCTAIVSILGYLGILIIEIHVGVTIFKIFSPKLEWGIISAIFLLGLILAYTYMGGYKAVVDTDKLQLILIAVGTLLGLAALGILYAAGPRVNNVFVAEKLAPWPWLLPVPFIVVMVFGNVPFQMLRMSNWLRAAAVRDLATVQRSLRRSIVATFVSWILFSVMGLLLFGVARFGPGQGAVALLELFESKQDVFMSYIAFPAVFSAMVAAMVSTADSVFIPILTAYIYDFRFHNDLHDATGFAAQSVDEASQKRLLGHARHAIVWFLLLAVGVYLFLTEVVGFEFVDLLFVFFNQQLVLFPAVVLALKGPKGAAAPARLQTLIGLGLAWTAAWSSAIYGRVSGRPDLVLYSSIVAFGVSLLATFLLGPRTFIKVVSRKA